MERSKEKFKGNYRNKVVLAMLSLMPDRTATACDMSFVWCFLQQPEHIVDYLRGREDVRAWITNYPDRLAPDEQLLDALMEMGRSRQIMAVLNPVNPHLDPKVCIAPGFVFAKTGKGMENVFMDVRYAMEAMAAMKDFSRQRELRLGNGEKAAKL